MSGPADKDPQKLQIIKKRSFAFRLNVFFFLTFIVFSLLIVRLAFLQLVHGESYAAQEIQNELKTTTIPPIRGNILDRNGSPIAYSTSTQSLYYRLNNLSASQLLEIAEKLEKIFREYGDDPEEQPDAEEIMTRMDAWFGYDGQRREPRNWSYVPRRIKTDLTDREIAYFVEHRDEFPGFEIMEESIRNYVLEDDGKTGIAVQLVGYLRQFSTASNLPDSYLNYYKDPENTYEYLPNETVGLDGIEFMFQKELRGKNGYRTYTVDSVGNITGEVTVQPPTKGSDIYLTIDKHVQLVAEQAIEDHLALMKTEEAAKTNLGKGANATTGYAVAMEVDTGKVIAMASYPDYDPNVWRGGTISIEDYEEYEYFFKNGTIRESYPKYDNDEERKKHPTSLVYLGSTVKPLSVLIGLQEGLFSPNEIYLDTGEYFYGRNNSWRIQNSNFQKNGRINAEDAIRVSSNTFMAAMIGERLAKRGEEGLRTWDSWMAKFGLGVSTGSGLPGEHPGIKDYEHEARNASVLSALVRASWGQQAKYTTLQLAQYATMLANRGTRLKPQLVEKIVGPDGQIEWAFTEPEMVDEEKVEIRDEYWDLVHRGMLKVFRTGFDGFPYPVAAKTGTSTQQVYGGTTIDNAVFIAFAPADNPKLAVAVIVPEGGFGSYGAAPIARAIFDAYDEAIGLTGVPRAATDNATGDGQ
jgi:penicillin-binding protein 2